MHSIFTALCGLLVGFCLHVVAMKISFKQRTIDEKIKLYAFVISRWVKMRNTIITLNDSEYKKREWTALDKIYGDSQAYIGGIILVSEDENFSETINNFNELYYRKGWFEMSQDKLNAELESI